MTQPHRFYGLETMVLVLKKAGFEGLTCDPAAYECRGCSLDRMNPDDCFNPDCHGGYAWPMEDGTTIYRERRPPR